LHEQIEALTQQLKEQPKNAVLYVQRGLLYQAHGSYEEATNDFQKALKVDKQLKLVYLHLSQSYLGQEQADSALYSIQTYLTHFPNNPTALISRGEAYSGLKQYDLAALDYEKSIELKGEKTTVQDYISWSKSVSSTNGDAVACLEKGMTHLGKLITLQQEALNLELKTAQYEAAVWRIDTILEGLQRKEIWLVKKAEVLILAKRETEATTALNEARLAIGNLKPRAKNTDVIKKLMDRIEELEPK